MERGLYNVKCGNLKFLEQGICKSPLMEKRPEFSGETGGIK